MSRDAPALTRETAPQKPDWKARFPERPRHHVGTPAFDLLEIHLGTPYARSKLAPT